MATSPVSLELGVNPCLTRPLELGWSGPGGDHLQHGVVLEPGAQNGLESGVDLGAHGPRIRLAVWLDCLAFLGQWEKMLSRLIR